MNIYVGNFLSENFNIYAKKIWGVESYNICIMNPPYNQMLDLAFIKKTYELSNIVLTVHPSTWLLDKKGIQKKFTSTKELVKNDLISIELFNGNGVFGISLFVPCVISYINKNLSHNGIKCLDRINKTELTYDNIDEINKFSNVDVYPQLKKKIEKACLKYDNLNNVVKTQKDKTYFVNLAQIRGDVKFRDRLDVGMDVSMIADNFYTMCTKDLAVSFFVNLAQIRGHIKDTNKTGLGMDSEMLFEDFYTMCTKDLNVMLDGKQQPVSFTSKIESENFLNYIKTNFVRFCLAIYKNNGNLHRGELALIPWLDFTQEWTDEKLYKHFDLTQEEINFIEKIIPKYY